MASHFLLKYIICRCFFVNHMNVMKIIVYHHKYEYGISYNLFFVNLKTNFLINIVIIANLFIVKNRNQSKFKGIIVN